jgi:hypothetical protein
MHFICEHFKNINHLLSTITTRPNNKIMEDQHSSEKIGESDWNGTETWDEAVTLLRNGYTDILPDIRKNMQRDAKTYYQYSQLPKAMPKNRPIGYIPNVPNSIMNLPDSMIFIDRVPQKRKTLSLVYNISGSAFEDKEFFIKAGASVCSALNIIESKGIQTELSVGFMPAKTCGEEQISPIVTIKNYGQKFDLQKICFPLAHPSMFRRIGFKYLETCPEIINSGWKCGYGSPITDIDIDQNYKNKLGIDDNNTFLLTCHWVRENDYDVAKILEYFKIKE